jgi:hypothetical protein
MNLEDEDTKKGITFVRHNSERQMNASGYRIKGIFNGERVYKIAQRHHCIKDKD